ncbi:MAG: hypothetical protein ABI615_13995 [Chthoniobacterales bacterium]
MKLYVLLLFPLILTSLLHAQSTDDLLKKGDQLDLALNNKEALQVYLEADKLHPNDSHILHRISREYALMMADVPTRKEKTELATAALDYALRAKTADPGNAKARLGLAICYGRMAELQSPSKRVEYARKIEEEAQTSVKLDPTDDYAWHVLGRWNYEVARLNPFLAFIVKGLYGKLPDASNAKAIEYFTKAIAINPNRLIHHAEIGRTYAAAGNKALARKELELALSMPDKEKDDEETKARARAALAQL